jgi:hypothetical protein
MNLHETLTNRRSNAHAVPIAFSLVQEARSSRPAPTLMTTTRRTLPALLLAAVLGVLLLLPAGASAATCDVNDMIDAAANSRQITTHTTACYKQVLAHLPGDVDGYAPQVRINLIAALQRDAGLRSKLAGGTGRELAGYASASPVAPAVRGPVTNLLQDLGPAHVDEVPVPVVALGGAAALLLLAGLGTSLSRVRQRRLTR